jgi:outer membrane protein assembly factor BamB
MCSGCGETWSAITTAGRDRRPSSSRTCSSATDGFDYQYVIALDKTTGETVWRTERPVDFGTDNGDMKKAYATPIVIDVNGRQQLISPCSKGTFAYDPRTGEGIWRARYEGFSVACRPLYEAGLVIISSGFSRAELLAIDPSGSGDVTDTHIRWMVTEQMPSKPSPLWIDGRIYTIHDQGVMSCLDGPTGETIWQDRAGGNFTASPVYAGGHIYIPSEEGETLVLAPGDAANVVATNVLDAGALASPAVIGDSLLLRTTTHLYRIANGGQSVASE